MSLLFHQTFVRVRATLVEDRYKNKKRDWDNAAREEFRGVNIQPVGAGRQAAEENDDRLTLVTGWVLQTPEGVDLDLQATDRVEFDGMTLEVEGKVGRWPDPFGPGVHHVEARLKEID